MLIEHQSRRPKIDPSGWIAPTAVLSGDVRVGRDCRVLFGAVLTDDGGPIELSDEVIVMENALIRGRDRHPVRSGHHVIVGPHAHINGAEVDDDAFIATGAALFPPDRHEEIWTIQRELDFPGTVFGLPRDSPALPAAVARRYADWLASHRSDRPAGNQ